MDAVMSRTVVLGIVLKNPFFSFCLTLYYIYFLKPHN